MAWMKTWKPWWAHLMAEGMVSTKKGRLLAEYVRTLAAFIGSRLWDGDHSAGDLLGSVSVGFPRGASGKEPACQFRRPKKHKFDPWVGKISWRRACNPLLYSCLENPMARGAWLATVHRSQRVRHEWSDLARMHASAVNTRVEKRWKQEWAKGKILSWTLFINFLKSI